MKSQKWLVAIVSVTLGASNIFAVSLVARKSDGLPKFNLPVSQYSAYEITVDMDGDRKSYNIKHRMNDPKIISTIKDIRRPGGFLGLGKTHIYKTDQHAFGEGQTSAQPEGYFQSLSDKEKLCIKAEGSGESTGGVIGGAASAAVAPSLSTIPIIGPVLTGAATMFGINQGAKIGGQMAKDFKDC